MLGGPEIPGRVYSDEVYFALSPARPKTMGLNNDLCPENNIGYDWN